ncbi:MAG: hypothetical protein QF886_18515, partial [Planctomycetota bacterium]|nr:hypothetical protein [Planctomycetota bacterium]
PRQSPTFFLKLEGAEPFLSNSASFPLPQDGVKVRPDRPLPDDKEDFPSGRFGKGLRLGNGRTLIIPTGEVTSDHTREFFDARRGSIEFWFRLDRPGWESAHTISLPLQVPAIDTTGKKLGKPLLVWGAKTWRFGNGRGNIARNLQPWLPWRMDDRWHHLCISFDHRYELQENDHALYRVWLDGAPRYQSYDWSVPVAIEPGQAGETWTLGGQPCSWMVIDDMRISNKVRHEFTEVFKPLDKPHPFDSDTLLHFTFDGKTTAEGRGAKVVEAVLNR